MRDFAHAVHRCGARWDFGLDTERDSVSDRLTLRIYRYGLYVFEPCALSSKAVFILYSQRVKLR